jgi:hypothetical protein
MEINHPNGVENFFLKKPYSSEESSLELDAIEAPVSGQPDLGEAVVAIVLVRVASAGRQNDFARLQRRKLFTCQNGAKFRKLFY